MLYNHTHYTTVAKLSEHFFDFLHMYRSKQSNTPYTKVCIPVHLADRTIYDALQHELPQKEPFATCTNLPRWAVPLALPLFSTPEMSPRSYRIGTEKANLCKGLYFVHCACLWAWLLCFPRRALRLRRSRTRSGAGAGIGQSDGCRRGDRAHGRDRPGN